MKSKKKGFTLLELLITIGIIGILFVILFRAYTSISQVTFRVQQEKNIQQETIRIAQSLQNIADNHGLDFDAYSGEQITDTLFLSGEEGKASITTTGVCASDSPAITGFTEEQKDHPCQLLFITDKGEQIFLTTPSESIISKPSFTILPYKTNDRIIKEDQNPFLHIQQPGFQIHFSIYTPLYKENERIRTSNIVFQQFFNLQK